MTAGFGLYGLRLGWCGPKCWAPSSAPSRNAKRASSVRRSIRATGSALLTRAQHAGYTAGGVDISDLLRLVNAIAWASEQVPDDPDLLDRLLALINPLRLH